LVFKAKGWAKGFRIEDKDVKEIKKYICICVCTHEKKKEREERKNKKREKKKRKERKIKREKDPRQEKGYNEG
jgi:hypothetical protein